MKGKQTAADFLAAKVARASESLAAAKVALERNRGNLTEQDWVDQVARAEARLADLTE